MPIFKEPNCLSKFFELLFGLVAVYSIIVYATMVTIGLYAGIIVMVLLILLQLLIVDSYGDSLLTDSKYTMSESEIQTFGNRKIVYDSKKNIAP